MTNGRPDDHLISAFHDGELTAADRVTAQRLLEDSADARAELDDYRALSELLGVLPKELAPADLRAAVMRQVARSPAFIATLPLAKPKQTRHLKRGILALVGGLTAAAGLLLAVNLFDARNGDPAPHSVPVADAEPAPPASGTFVAESVGATSEAYSDANDGPSIVMEAAPVLREFSREFAESDFVTPEDASPGDIYRYLEQTDDGTVVVVDATVVDVRKALNQVQLLLTNNSIPTVSVGIDATTSDRRLSDSTDGNLAVYVESEPGQMNGALMDLDSALSEEKSPFLSFQVSGVLDTPPVAEPSVASPPANLDSMSSPRGEAAAAETLLKGAAPGTSGREMREPMGRARFSVPLEERPEAGLPLPAPAEPAVKSQDFNVLEARGGTADPAATMPRQSANQFGYQQIVNFSKDELKGQLRQQSRETDAEKLPRVQQNAPQDRAFRGTADESGIAGGQSVKNLTASDTKQTAPGQRRLRLLLVLEAEPPAKADASGPPVEAPRPVRKKG